MQTHFGEDNHMIETLATSGSDKSLDERILPRRPWGCEHFFDPHRFRRGAEAVERLIAIVQQVA
jgi:hypothetical protein